MTRISVATVALSTCLLALSWGSNPCAAQDPNRDTIMAPTDVGTVVDRIEKQSRAFKDEFNDAVGHSMIDGTRLEENAKHRADDLHSAAAKLGDVFHDKKDKNNPAVRQQVDKLLAAASELNRVVAMHRFTDKIQSDWEVLRSELNGLAAMYQLSPIESKG